MTTSRNPWGSWTLLVTTAVLLTACASVQPVPPRLGPTSYFDAVVFDATFDSASLDQVDALDAHRFLVKPRPSYGRDAPRWEPALTDWNGHTWWYHFAVTVPERLLPYDIELRIDRSRVKRPRMYDADKWPVISCDGQTWRYVRHWDVEIAYGIMTETLTCPTTYVALATPYPWSQMVAYVEGLKRSPYIVAHEVISHTPVGENGDRLPLYYLRLTDRASPGAKRNVVVISGQHPGEVVNAWALTGLVEFLLSAAPVARILRQHFAFHIYPAVNPEGVKHGHYRRTADSPLNPNRAWRSKEVFEVLAVREHILAQTGGRADYFFDLHNASRAHHYIYHFVDQPGASAFVSAVGQRHPHVNVDDGHVKWHSGRTRRLAYEWSMTYLRTHRNRTVAPLSMTPEGSYAQGSWKGQPSQTEDWKAFGAALVQAIYDVESLEGL